MDLVNITDCSSIAIATSIRPGVPQMFHVRVLETTAAFWAVLRQFLARSHTGSGALGFLPTYWREAQKKGTKGAQRICKYFTYFYGDIPETDQ